MSAYERIQSRIGKLNEWIMWDMSSLSHHLQSANRLEQRISDKKAEVDKLQRTLMESISYKAYNNTTACGYYRTTKQGMGYWKKYQ